MQRVVPWVLLGCVACGRGYRGPDCEDVLHSPVTVDTTTDPVQFAFDGDQPNGFAVLDELGAPAWELVCECERNAGVEGGELDCRDKEDREFLKCIPLELTYGVVPEIDTLSREDGVTWEAAPMIPGDTYTALIWTTCQGRGFRDIVRFTDFAAPALAEK
ncbi:MAG: hypothetical protein KTR31_05355 [Myxococcales bacterium]|nr:hypothetical protein [Myxococcales bacterium]